MPFPVLTPADAPTADAWLTTSEAHRLSGVPLTRFYNWARSGAGPEHRKIGHRWMWLRSSLIDSLSV